jgi:MFS transporter, SP family, general alpha glucoside:H+ symporter
MSKEEGIVNSELDRAEIDARATQQDEHITTKFEACKRNPKIVGWIALMVWTLVIVGFDNSASGQVLSIPQFRKNFGYLYEGEYLLDAKWQSAISGGPTAMNVIGIVCSSWLADRIGKKPVIAAALVLSTTAIGVEFGCKSLQMFFAGKMMNGIALGTFNGLCVAYVAEVSPLSIRAVATGCCNLAQTIGPFIGSIMGNFVGTWTTEWSYKSLFVAQWGFAIFALVAQPFMPESPWFYLKHGHEDKARKSLQRLYSNDEDAENHLKVLKITLEEANTLNSAGGSYIDCFKGTNRRRTLIAVLVFATHPFSGVSFISSYGAFIYQLIGIKTAESFHISVGAQVLSMSGTLVSFLIVDRFGRRPLLIGGVTSMSLILLLSASTGTATQNPHARLACVAFLTMFNFFYNGGIGAIAYTIASEIPTAVLRTKTFALAIAFYQSMNTMWTFVLPYIINPGEADLGARVGFIFFGFTLICLTLVIIFVPEISNRTYEEMDELFANKVPAWKFKSYVTAAQERAKMAYNVREKTEAIEHVEQV